MAELANGAAELLGLGPRYTADRFQVRYDYAGPNYGVVSGLEREAIRLLARHEGVLLDPVYTSWAMGALIDMVRQGFFPVDEAVLFWYTGGNPALFEYSRELS